MLSHYIFYPVLMFTSLRYSTHFQVLFFSLSCSYKDVSSILMRILGQAFYPHFTPFYPISPPPPRTTFKNFLNTLKNTFRYIIQLHHHIIYLTYTSKSFQLNSISYIHTKQSSHIIYI